MELQKNQKQKKKVCMHHICSVKQEYYCLVDIYGKVTITSMVSIEAKKVVQELLAACCMCVRVKKRPCTCTARYSLPLQPWTRAWPSSSQAPRDPWSSGTGAPKGQRKTTTSPRRPTCCLLLLSELSCSWPAGPLQGCRTR